MDDDKRSPTRAGKPLVYGEIIISESIYVQNLEAARAAGYAEAIEQAAKVANDVDTARRYPPQLRGIVEGVDTDVAKAIRALAPATTKEPK